MRKTTIQEDREIEQLYELDVERHDPSHPHHAIFTGLHGGAGNDSIYAGMSGSGALVSNLIRGDLGDDNISIAHAYGASTIYGDNGTTGSSADGGQNTIGPGLISDVIGFYQEILTYQKWTARSGFFKV